MMREAQTQIDHAVADGRPATTQAIVLGDVKYTPEHYADASLEAHWHGERREEWTQPVRVVALHAAHGGGM